MNRVGRDPRRRRARGLPARRRARRRAWSSATTPGTAPTSSPATPPRSSRPPGGSAVVLPAPAADAGAGLRDPAPRLRRRRHGDRQPQPAAGQRLQGLSRRRQPDRAAGRRRASRPRSPPSPGPSDVPLADDGWVTLDDEPLEAYLDAVAAVPRPRHPAGPVDRPHAAARRRPGRAGRGPGPGRLRRAVRRCLARGSGPGLPDGRLPEPGGAGRDRRGAGRGRASAAPTSCWPTTRTPTGAPWPCRTPTADGGWRMLRGDEVGVLLGAHLIDRGVPGRRRLRQLDRLLALAGRDLRRRRHPARGDAHRLQVDRAGCPGCATATRRRSATASTRRGPRQGRRLGRAADGRARRGAEGRRAARCSTGSTTWPASTGSTRATSSRCGSTTWPRSARRCAAARAAADRARRQPGRRGSTTSSSRPAACRRPTACAS